MLISIVSKPWKFFFFFFKYCFRNDGGNPEFRCVVEVARYFLVNSEQCDGSVIVAIKRRRDDTTQGQKSRCKSASEQRHTK